MMWAVLLTIYPQRYDEPLEQHINGSIANMFAKSVTSLPLPTSNVGNATAPRDDDTYGDISAHVDVSQRVR